MANNCFFDIRVKGAKEDRERLFNILNYKDDEYFLSRIFSIEADENYTTLWGDCAWSVHTCMREGVGAYLKEEDKDSDGRKRTTIGHLSNILNLEIEILSEESGIGFCEHYYYNKGEEIVKECIDYPTE